MQAYLISLIFLALLLSGCETLPVFDATDATAPVIDNTTAAIQEQCAAPEGNPITPESFVELGLIREIQARLVLLGYEPGQMDGIYGKKTEQGIRAYQVDHHLLTDGRPSPELLEHLKNTQQISGIEVMEDDKKLASQ